MDPGNSAEDVLTLSHPSETAVVGQVAKFSRSSTASSSPNFITTLTEGAGLFLFSFSPRQGRLVACSNNAPAVLGLSETEVMLDASLFLSGVPTEDRYAVLEALENALDGRSDYCISYRWKRPDSKEITTLHCQAKLVAREEGPQLEGCIFDFSKISSSKTAQILAETGQNLDDLRSTFEATAKILKSELLLIGPDGQLVSKSCGHSSPGVGYLSSTKTKRSIVVGDNFIQNISPEKRKASLELAFDRLRADPDFSHLEKISVGNRSFECTLNACWDGNGQITGFVWISRDISEITQQTKKFNSQLKANHGLEEMLHEVKNSLQSLLHQVNLLDSSLKGQRVKAPQIHSILELCKRLTEITRSEEIQEENTTPTVLLIDDDHMVLDSLSSMVRSRFVCLTASTHRSALELLKKNSSLKVILLDALMPDGDCRTFVRKLKKLYPNMAIAICSGAPKHLLEPLKKAGIKYFLSKPVETNEILELVGNIANFQQVSG